MSEKKPLDPYKTICVCRVGGKEVGRIPATAKNAAAYLDEMARTYAGRPGGMKVDYEEDTTGGLLAALHGGHRNLDTGGRY